MRRHAHRAGQWVAVPAFALVTWITGCGGGGGGGSAMAPLSNPGSSQGTASVSMNLQLRAVPQLGSLQNPELVFQVVAAGTSQPVSGFGPVTIDLTAQDVTAIENNQPISENPTAVTVPANTPVQILVALEAGQSGQEQTVLEQASVPLDLAPATSTTITVSLTQSSQNPPPSGNPAPHLYAIGFNNEVAAAFRIDNPGSVSPNPAPTVTQLSLPSGASPISFASIESNAVLDEAVIQNFMEGTVGQLLDDVPASTSTAFGNPIANAGFNDVVPATVPIDGDSTHVFVGTDSGTGGLSIVTTTDPGNSSPINFTDASTNQTGLQIRVDGAFPNPGGGPTFPAAFVLDLQGNLHGYGNPSVAGVPLFPNSDWTVTNATGQAAATFTATEGIVPVAIDLDQNGTFYCLAVIGDDQFGVYIIPASQVLTGLSTLSTPTFTISTSSLPLPNTTLSGFNVHLCADVLLNGSQAQELFIEVPTQDGGSQIYAVFSPPTTQTATPQNATLLNFPGLSNFIPQWITVDDTASGT